MTETKIDVKVEQLPAAAGRDAKHPNTCPGCGSHYRDDELERSLYVCGALRPPLPDARARADRVARRRRARSSRRPSRRPLGRSARLLRPAAVRERLAEAELNTGLTEAIVVGAATLDGHPLELAVMDFAFLGGSMGSAVGEKFVRACDVGDRARHAAAARLELGRRPDAGGDPLADAAAEDGRARSTSCTTPGCRCSASSTHPTTGGVMASFASLGDVTIAEPGALLAFTGPRVVQQIIKEKLPDDFGRAEQNLRFGQIDAILPRSEQRPYLARLLRLFAR